MLIHTSSKMKLFAIKKNQFNIFFILLMTCERYFFGIGVEFNFLTLKFKAYENCKITFNDHHFFFST